MEHVIVGIILGFFAPEWPLLIAGSLIWGLIGWGEAIFRGKRAQFAKHIENHRPDKIADINKDFFIMQYMVSAATCLIFAAIVYFVKDL